MSDSSRFRFADVETSRASRFSYGAAILGCEKAAEWQLALFLAMDAKRGVDSCNATKQSGG